MTLDAMLARRKRHVAWTTGIAVADCVSGEHTRTRHCSTAVDRGIAHQLLTAGWSYRQVADRLGYAVGTVQNWCPGMGVRDNRLARHTTAVRNSARRLLAEGMSYKQVARQIGCTPSTVARWWPGMGLTPEQVAAAQSERIKAKWATGWRGRWE